MSICVGLIRQLASFLFFSLFFFACLTDFALAQKMFASYEGELAEAKKALKGYIQSIPSAKGGESPKRLHPFLFAEFLFSKALDR